MASSSLSGIAVPMKLSSSILRIITVRKRCVRANSIVFLAVSAHHERRNVDYSPAHAGVALADPNCGRGEWTSPSLNVNALVCKHRSVIFAAVGPNT